MVITFIAVFILFIFPLETCEERRIKLARPVYIIIQIVHTYVSRPHLEPLEVVGRDSQTHFKWLKWETKCKCAILHLR